MRIAYLHKHPSPEEEAASVCKATNPSGHGHKGSLPKERKLLITVTLRLQVRKLHARASQHSYHNNHSVINSTMTSQTHNTNKALSTQHET